MAEQSVPGEGRGPGAADPLRFRDDWATEEAAISVDALAAQPDALAVRVEPDDDVRALLPHLGTLRLIEVSFPSFGDGRGFSSARILREHGYTGELRAVGDVLVDQLAFLRRCGFDAFSPDSVLDEADVQAALLRWPEVYQSAADGRMPVWHLRHSNNG